MRCGPLPVALLSVLVGCGVRPQDTDGFHVTAAMHEAAADAFDRDALRASLEAIESWHRAKGTAIPSLLRAGLTDAAIDDVFAGLGCRPPLELREIWKWHDGHADTASAQWLVWYHQLLPAEEAVREYRALRAQPFLAWNERWLPVLFFQEEWYFVECDRTERAASPLMFYFTESGPAPAYLNLTRFFATAAQAMSEGAVYATGEPPQMDADVRRLSAIHRAHNPGLPFPYHVPQ